MTEAELLIRSYQQTYPVDVPNLIMNLGLRLESADLGQISGHIAKEGEEYVIRTNANEHVYRQRFTMAHELGHFMLHRTLLDMSRGINDNTMYRTDRSAALYNSHIHQIHEQQANSFAANLLMPEDLVRRVYQEKGVASQNYDNEPDLTTLYRAFQVSPSAMTWRLKNLELWREEPVAA